MNMNRIERLIHNYDRYVSLPWDRSLSGAQKVWFVVYDKTDERRLRACLGEFELATKKANHGWALCDITNAFPEWMSTMEYKEEYFKAPEDLNLDDFEEYCARKVQSTFNLRGMDQDTVVAVLGVACLFGFMKVSTLVHAVKNQIPGRLVVFFPGEYETNTYRLLDARDGWNYMAVPITYHEEQ
jgi:hypothetical protein